ncbi:hypothetical protein JAAARDRAFT_370757 [Jaapia argillacea MUCL 33604]|uniref:Uncharacterized protein n=1 Tax=Jaapia argillacea MUCL 33604 TaxID=933084 RepID=A0A067QKP4_9AGAM|nr:hypothetical protein JAAARDRAFT_370757 [Jaapia argillacea MUCL 33604]
MFGTSWFVTKSSKQGNDQSTEPGTEVRVSTEATDLQDTPVNGPQTEDAATAAALEEAQIYASLDYPPDLEVPQVSEPYSVEPLAKPEAPPPSQSQSQSPPQPSSSSSQNNRIYDPFTGAPIGDLRPLPSTSLSDPPESSREDLWSHLASIRLLESQIATMHVQMEGIGLNDPAKAGLNKAGKKRVVAERIVSTTMRLKDRESVWDTEGEPDTEGEDEENKKRDRDEEFEKLADRFTGRKEAIDGIMNKLDELSQALTAFHALEPPTMDLFTNSRNNTNQTERTTSPSIPQLATTSQSMPVPASTAQPSLTPPIPSASTPVPSNPQLDKADTVSLPTQPSDTKPAPMNIPAPLLTRLGEDRHHLMESPASTNMSLP